MDIVVNDTNILIDLYHADLLKYCKLMSLEFYTLQAVIDELNDEDQQEQVKTLISEGTLKIKTLNETQLYTVHRMLEEFHGVNNLSFTDISVMIYAKDNQLRLLTGDKELRKQAQNEGVLVSGFLYLTDKMVLDDIVSPLIMADTLEYLLKIKRRLPKVILSEKIKLLREQINSKGYRL